MSDPRIEIVTEAIDPGAFERCEPEKLAPTAYDDKRAADGPRGIFALTPQSQHVSGRSADAGQVEEGSALVRGPVSPNRSYIATRWIFIVAIVGLTALALGYGL